MWGVLKSLSERETRFWTYKVPLQDGVQDSNTVEGHSRYFGFPVVQIFIVILNMLTGFLQILIFYAYRSIVNVWECLGGTTCVTLNHSILLTLEYTGWSLEKARVLMSLELRMNQEYPKTSLTMSKWSMVNFIW